INTYYSEHELWPELVELLSAEAARVEVPDHAGALLRQVALLQRDKLRDEAGAARTLRKAMEIAPGDMDVLRDLTASLVSSGDTAAARAVVREALATDVLGARPVLLRLRADLAIAGGDEPAAVADMEEALTLGANDVVQPLSESLTRIVERATEAGDLAVARAATLRLAEVAQLSGDQDQAEHILFHWIDTNPGDREVLQVMRTRFEAEERWDASASVWSRLVQIEEGESKAQAVLSLANACEKADRSAEAIYWCKEVLGQMPGHAEVQARLAQLLASSGNAVEAAQLQIDMAEGQTEEGERYQLLVRAAETLLGAQAFPAAVQALERAVTLRPAERSGRALLIDACMGTNELQRAADVLAGLLGESKLIRAEELGALYQRQARLAAAQGDRDGQLQALRKALDTDRKSVAIATEAADLAESVGDDELAMRALRVITANPIKDARSSAMAYYRLGRIAYKARDKARAIIFVKRALQEDPDLAEAHRLLDELK
ncbi:MAG TPA: tetratricopeptide repeat protein, partial [Polyangia bacterium]